MRLAFHLVQAFGSVHTMVHSWDHNISYIISVIIYPLLDSHLTNTLLRMDTEEGKTQQFDEYRSGFGIRRCIGGPRFLSEHNHFAVLIGGRSAEIRIDTMADGGWDIAACGAWGRWQRMVQKSGIGCEMLSHGFAEGFIIYWFYMLLGKGARHLWCGFSGYWWKWDGLVRWSRSSTRGLVGEVIGGLLVQIPLDTYHRPVPL